MSQRSRRHHTVSNFYLKGFANEAGEVQQVHLSGNRSHTVSTENVAVDRDFYTVRMPDGTLSDAVEVAFAQIENEAALALHAVIGGTWPLSRELREALGGWLALQLLRGPSSRSQQTQLQAEFIRMIVGMSGKEALRHHIETALGHEISEEHLQSEWFDLTKSGGPTLVSDPVMHARTIAAHLVGLTQLLLASQWVLVRFKRRALASADHPVTLVPDVDHPEALGVGILNASGIVVPLSRRVGLQVQYFHDNEPDVELPGTTALAEFFNTMVISNARRFIYHHPSDDPIRGLTLPSPRSREIGELGDDFISEGGILAGLSSEELKAAAREAAHSKRLLSEDGESGLSLADLGWPIPGRVPPKS